MAAAFSVGFVMHGNFLSLFFAGTLVCSAGLPTVFFTDIGNDIDDTWALAHLLRSPELDLRMVLTETGDARYRAAVTAKVLETANRTDVAVGLGIDFGPTVEDEQVQGPWIRGYDLAAYPGPLHPDGVQAFIDLVRRAEETVVVIAVGPVPSLARAIELAPDIAARCRLYGMHGSFDIGYNGQPPIDAEYNVRADVPALRRVLAADWQSIRLTPLDTCGLMHLAGERYQRIWKAMDDSLLRAVVENYCIWAPRVPWLTCDFFTQRTSTLFDDVAVYMSYGDDYLEYETIRFQVTDDGRTVRDPQGDFVADVAIRWTDMSGFQDWLTARLTGPIAADQF